MDYNFSDDLSSRPALKDLPLIDEKNGIERVMGDKALFVTLLTFFHKNHDFSEFDNVWRNEKKEQLIPVLHTLRGLAGNLSLLRLEKTIEALESSVKKGNLDENEYAMLKDCFNDTKKAVKVYLED